MRATTRHLALALWLCASPALAHSGSVAYAYPLSRGVVDGDLSEWPSDGPVYRLARTELGTAPRDTVDFQGHFRVAWEGATGSLWIAVEILDDDLVLDGEAVTSWRDMRRFFGMMGWRSRRDVEVPPLADGCAVIVDLGHADGDSRAVRFGVDGDDRRSIFTSSEGDTVDWRDAEVATRLTAGRRVYEWRLDLTSSFLRESDMAAPKLRPGTVLGFDVTAADRDRDGSLSWVTWGPGAGKVWGSRTSRRADLVLVTDAVAHGTLRGQATWNDSLAGEPPTAVRVRPRTGAARWVAATDAEGRFELSVPAGDYLVRLEDERLGLDRLEASVTVSAGGTSPVIRVRDEPLWRQRSLADTTRALVPRQPPSGKQRGVSWVGSRIVGRDEVAALDLVHTDWIVQTPFGWQRDITTPVLQAPTGEAGLWGESDRGVAITTQLARSRGIRTLLKPHIWTGRGTWRGELAMTSEEDWATWFAQYERFILHFARLAEANGIEGLCVGTELAATLGREAEWRRIIARVREVYGGWLIYAANWTSFEQVPFWDAVDFVGVQAYFPLAAAPTEEVAVLVAGWEPWLQRLQAVATASDRRVVFTEIGYRTNANAAVEPWLWERQVEGGGDEAGRRTQAACYEAFFHAAWDRPWVAGAYFWKWFPQHGRSGGDGDPGFTPQNKPAQQVLADRFRRQRVLDAGPLTRPPLGGQ